jgi:uncharacterized cupredoxin-like copper-binding protein
VKVGRSIFVIIAVAALVGGVAAPVAAASVPKNNVRLVDFKIKPKRAEIAPGKTKFVVKNAGDDDHEFVVVRGTDPSALPTKPDGSVDEDRISEADQIGALEGIESGKTRSTKYKLEPGPYILYCNLVVDDSDGKPASHFAKGMHATLTVRGQIPIPTVTPATNPPVVTTRREHSP